MTALPRLNPVIRALESGTAAFTTFAQAGVENAIALSTTAYDGVVFEMEHNPWDALALRDSLQFMLNRAQIVRSGSLAPAVAPLVRIPPNGAEKLQFHAKQALIAQFVQARLLAQLTVGVSPWRQKIRLGLLVLAVACARPVAVGSAAPVAVRPGISVLVSDSIELIRGRRIGLITNQTGIDERRVSDIDLLRGRAATDAGVRLVRLFSPEHGIRGTEDREHIASGNYDIVILDELTYCLKFGWLEIDEVLDTLRSRPDGQHVVITGRDAPAELIEFADLVTEMRELKHPYRTGVRAQAGIEF